MKEYHLDGFIKYRIDRSKETIDEVKTHIEKRFWNTAINRMYYSCFYAVGALLLKNNIEVNSHAGARQKFGQVFVKTGRFDRKLAKHYTGLFEKGTRAIKTNFLTMMR